ncbi:MAG: glycosyltransferase family 1 protein [Gemmatimonadales bacterium]
MRIGIMLRHLDQSPGGVRHYTHRLLQNLLAIDSPHRFFFLYQNPKLVGTYPDDERHREVVFSAPSKIFWDQYSVARAVQKLGLELVFNPKFSVSLLADVPSLFVCHGLDWYVMPWGSLWRDRLSHKLLIPRYARKAAGILTVSDTARDHVLEFLPVDSNRVRTVYLGVDEIFRRPVPRDEREQMRKKYGLPSRFFLYCGQIYPAKNFGGLLRAYREVGPRLGIPLVVAGQHAFLCKEEIDLVAELDIVSWVRWLGWVNHSELPAVYALAEALVLPSLYEGFGIPLVEAMAVGCPVVTSNRYSSQEIVADAGITVDPEDPSSIAKGMERVATQDGLRESLIEAGRERAASFSWRRCAEETLEALERAYPG